MKKLKKITLSLLSIFMIVTVFDPFAQVYAKELDKIKLQSPYGAYYKKNAAKKVINTEIVTDGKKDILIQEPQSDSKISDYSTSQEVIEKRTETSKTFEISPHRYATEDYGIPVHKKVDGKYVDIDNTLEKKTSFFRSTPSYQNADGLFDVDIKNGYVDMENTDGSSLTIMSEGDMNHYAVKDNAILYHEVDEAKDVEYRVRNNHVAVSTILHEGADEKEFSFKIDKGNLKSEIKDDVLLLKRGKKIEFISAGAQVNDASGSSEPLMTTYEEKDNVIEVRMKPSSEFLEKANYPLTLSASVGTDSIPATMNTSYIRELSPTMQSQYSHLYVGIDDQTLGGPDSFIGITWSFITFGMPDIGKYQIVDSASIGLVKVGDRPNMHNTVNVFSTGHYVNPSEVTWYTRPLDLTLLDTKTVGAASPDKYYSWDISDYVKNLADGHQNTLVFRSTNETTPLATYYYSHLSAKPPKVTILHHDDFDVNPDLDIDLFNSTMRVYSKTNQDFEAMSFDGLAKPGSNVLFDLYQRNASGKFDYIRQYSAPASPTKNYIDPIYITSPIANANTYPKDKVNYTTNYIKISDFPKTDAFYEFKVKIKDGDNVSTVDYKSDGFILYKVKLGDTLSSISNYYDISIDQIKKDNNRNLNRIKEGDVLFLRYPKEHTQIPLDAFKPPIKISTFQPEAQLYGNGCNGTCPAGDPINTSTGNFYHESKDFELYDYDNVSLTRTYNSMSANESMFGKGFASNLEQYVTFTKNNDMLYFAGDGKIIKFTYNNGNYTSDPQFHLKASVSSNQVIIKNSENKETYTFDDIGDLTTITNEKGFQNKVSRNAYGRVTSLTLGDKQVTFTYNKQHLIEKVQLPDGSSVLYRYNTDRQLISFQDAAGGVEQYHYDKNGRIDYIIDKNGNKLAQNTYDGKGRVLTQIDNSGNTIKFNYQNGKTAVTYNGKETFTYEIGSDYLLKKETMPDGTSKSYTYDSNKNITSQTNEKGEKTIYTFDSSNNMTQVQYSDGTKETYTYDTSGNITSKQKSGSQKEMYHYNSQGNIDKLTKTDGTYLLYEYNSKNQKTKETDQNGIWKTFQYSGNLLTKVQHQSGLIETFAYDARGNTIREEDNQGRFTSYEYDRNNKVIRKTNALHETERYKYDAKGNMIESVDAGGVKTSFTYDAAGNQLTSSRGGLTTSKKYDGYGRIISEKDEQGLTTKYEYDIRGNKTAEIDAYGNKTSFIYDHNDNLIKMIDPFNNVETKVYEHNRIKEETDKTGLTTKYEYDSNGHLIKTIKPNGKVIEQIYDAKGRLIETIDEYGHSSTKEYDGYGRIVKETDIHGIITENTYDAYGRIQSKTINGVTTNYTYDVYDNVVQESDVELGVTHKTYDALNRVILQSDVFGNTTKTSYDAYGNVTSTMNEKGAVTRTTYNMFQQPLSQIDELGNTTTYTYNNLGQMIAEKDPYGIITTYVYDKYNKLIKTEKQGVVLSEISYDSYGRKAKEITPKEEIKYTYDTFDRIIKEENTTTKLVSETEYDAYGNVTRIHDNGDQDTTREYNEFQQLIKETNSSGQKSIKEYDAYGNVITETSTDGLTSTYTYDNRNNKITSTNALGVVTYNTYNDRNQLVKTKTGPIEITYEYDKAGREISTYHNIKDANAYKEYDACGNLIKETDYAGRTTTYQYDAKNQQIQMEQPDQQISKKEYDAYGNIIKEIDAEGNVKQTVYNAFQLVEKEIDERGFYIENIYDENLNLIESKDKAGNSTTYLYNEQNQCSQISDGDGVTTTFEYDLYGRKIKETDGSGNVKTTTYNALGKIVSEDDGTRETNYIYDELGQLLETHVNGKLKEKNEYNELNQLVSKQDESGLVFKYTYDERGNKTSEKAKNRKLSYTYDDENQVIKLVENKDKLHEFTYDISGNQIEAKLNGTIIEKETYDANNNIIEQTLNHVTTRYQYDKLNRVISQQEINVDPSKSSQDDGVMPIAKQSDDFITTIFITYDEMGNVIRSTDCYGNTATRTYDALGNVSSETNTNDHTTMYEYDARGNITKVQNPMERILHLEYDDNNNLIKRSMDGSEAIYTYDKDNNLVKEVNEYGLKIKYKYDDEHRIISKTKPDGQKIKMVYDSAGRLKREGNRKYKYDAFGNLLSVKENYQEIKFTYDKFNRMTSYKDTEGNTISYTYDAFDRKTSIITPTNVISYTYNKYDEISSVKKDNKLIATYKYDKHGNVKQLKQGNYKTTYTYDNMDNVTSITHQKKKDVLTKLTYVYDGEGNVISETINDKENVYTYNEMEELATSSKYLNGKQVKTEYSYDLYGNQVETKNDGSFKKYEYNDNQQLEKITTNRGNTKLFYNKNGNISDIKYENGLEEHYTYDVHDQLTLLTNNKDHSYHYSYDPQGDRISIYKNIKDPLDTREWYQNIKNASIEEIREALKKEDSDDVFASLKEEHVYAKDAYKTCLYNEEKDPSDTLYETTINYILDKSEEHTQVLYENGKLNLYGNERLKSGDTTYLNGRNDTVIHAIRKGKDKQIEYEDFGYSDDLIKGYGYNGEAHDSSGLIYLRARYYNPQIARFIQIDSYEGEAENTQSQNRYSYVVNNPYKFIDPSGHKKKNSKKSKTKASKQSTISLGEMAARGGVAIVNTISKTMIGKNIVSQSLTNTIVKAANRLTPTYPVIDYEQRRTSTGFEIITNYKNGTKQVGAKIDVGTAIFVYQNKSYGQYAYIPKSPPSKAACLEKAVKNVTEVINKSFSITKMIALIVKKTNQAVDSSVKTIQYYWNHPDQVIPDIVNGITSERFLQQATISAICTMVPSSAGVKILAGAAGFSISGVALSLRDLDYDLNAYLDQEGYEDVQDMIMGTVVDIGLQAGVSYGIFKGTSALKGKLKEYRSGKATGGVKALNAIELKNIGEPGKSSGIRQVKGTEYDARKLFDNQVIKSTVKEVQSGVFTGQGADGFTYTFRANSSKISNYVPTIDVNGIKGLRKIKFIGE